MANYTGLDGLINLSSKLDQLTVEFGKGLLERAKQYTPVDTGLLKNSWQVTFDESNQQIILSNDAENKGGVKYGTFANDGTDKYAGFFMKERTINDAPSILAAAKRKVGL